MDYPNYLRCPFLMSYLTRFPEVRAEDLFQRTGLIPNFWRPPYGDVDNSTYCLRTDCKGWELTFCRCFAGVRWVATGAEFSLLLIELKADCVSFSRAIAKWVFALDRTIIWNSDSDDWCLQEGGGSVS
jgi:hypothetical protein